MSSRAGLRVPNVDESAAVEVERTVSATPVDVARTLAEVRAMLLHADALLAAVKAIPEPPTVTVVDQDDAETLAKYRLSRGAYLEHARANDFANDKVGRQIRTTTAALDAWFASCRRRPKCRVVADDQEDDAKRDVADTARRLRTRLERRAARGR